jgi:hypothetical protein
MRPSITTSIAFVAAAMGMNNERKRPTRYIDI